MAPSAVFFLLMPCDQVGQQYDLRLVTLAFRVKIDNFAAVKKVSS